MEPLPARNPSESRAWWSAIHPVPLSQLWVPITFGWRRWSSRPRVVSTLTSSRQGWIVTQCYGGPAHRPGVGKNLACAPDLVTVTGSASDLGVVAGRVGAAAGAESGTHHSETLGQNRPSISAIQSAPYARCMCAIAVDLITKSDVYVSAERTAPKEQTLAADLDIAGTLPPGAEAPGRGPSKRMRPVCASPRRGLFPCDPYGACRPNYDSCRPDNLPRAIGLGPRGRQSGHRHRICDRAHN